MTEGPAGYDDHPDGRGRRGRDRDASWSSTGPPSRSPASSAAAALGKELEDALPLEGLDGRAWWPCARPYDGLRSVTGHPERNLHPARRPGGPGHLALRPATSPRPGDQRRRGRARHPAPGPRGAQPGRAGLHRGPRAALTAHQRQGLHRHPARQVGPLQRRPEAADARDRQRRRRPGHPADHRAARHRPDRLGPARPSAARSSTSAGWCTGTSRRWPPRARTRTRFDVRVADGIPEMWVDADKLDQVLGNLLENAVRHGVGHGDHRGRAGR